MLAVLITLTPGRRKEFIDCPTAEVQIAVLPISYANRQWNLTLAWLERAYRLREFTCMSLNNPKYSDYWPLFITQDEWTTFRYMVEGLWPFWYWTLWMSKGNTSTQHRVITAYNDMFDHMDGVVWAVAKKKRQWKEHLYFTVNVVCQKLPRKSAEATPTTGRLHILAHILEPVWRLLVFRKWDKVMENNTGDETSYTTQYQETFPKYVENKYSAKHWRISVIEHEQVLHSIVFPAAKASEFGPSSFDLDDLSSNHEEYLMPESMAEMTPRQYNRATCVVTATPLCFNSPPESPKNRGQVNSNLNHYHSDPMEINSAFRVPDITNWWCQEDESPSKYSDLSNVAHDIFSNTPHGVAVETSFPLGRDDIGWRQSNTTGEKLCENVVVRQFTRASNGLLEGDCPALHTMENENNLQPKK